MIIVDRLLERRAAEGKPIRVGMVGAGFMARAVANTIINHTPGMVLAAVANRTAAKARDAYAHAGVTEVDEAESSGAISRAIERAVGRGRGVVTADASALCAADGIDVVIETTGAIEFGALVALLCFRNGKHLVSMNAELDATAGPILAHDALSAGVVYTLADGDQPGVQMDLYRFVRGMGLTPLLCGNIKGLHDPYRTPTTQASFAAKWNQTPHMVTSFADGTKISFEQACVANATGMSVLRRGMTGRHWQGHVDQATALFDIDRLRAIGGAVDYIVGAQPAPGVFVYASADDPRQHHHLKYYKMGDGPLYSFYTPYHLCHLQVPMSAARAVLLGDAVIEPRRPMVDVIAAAKRDLRTGETIDAPGGYMTYGLCENIDAAREQRLLPIGLAEGCRLVRDVSKDAAITADDVEVPAGRLIDRLRAEQERVFGRRAAVGVG